MKIKPEIREDLKRFLKEKLQRKQREITIVAPYKLSREDLAEIFEQYPQLESKVINSEVDPAILAGIIIKQGTKVLDLSLAERIKNLRNLANEIA